MTTFQSRELVRDELAALFTANGSWQEVYGYYPSVDEMANKTPVLIIRSRGTTQEMSGLNTNPATYRFLISSWVVAYDEAASWTSANAEDKLDELDKTLRQIVRDNANLTNADLIRLDGASTVADVTTDAGNYIVETRFLVARLAMGSV